MKAEKAGPRASGRGTRRRALLIVAGTSALIAAAAGGRGLPPAAAALKGDAAGVTSPRPQESEEILQLVVGDGGFEPAEVTRRAGKFLLTADDRRGDKSWALRLRLGREGGEQLREIEVPPGVTDWAEELDLPRGSYVLTEAGHPAWTCRVEITAP